MLSKVIFPFANHKVYVLTIYEVIKVLQKKNVNACETFLGCKIKKNNTKSSSAILIIDLYPQPIR